MTVTDQIRGFARPGPASATPAGAGLLQGTALKARLPLPALVYLLTVVLTIGFRLGPLYMTTLRLFLIVMIVPLMLRLLSGAYGRVFVTDILFVLHILWAAAAIGVNNPDQVVQQVGSVGIEFLGGYVVGRAYIRTPETFAALCRILIVMVLCSVPFALHETLTGRPLIVELLRKLPGMTSVAIVSIESRMGLERVQAVFAHPIHYGLFCSVAFSLCFVALRGAISDARRYVTSAVIAATGFLALSSGALTAIAMQIGLIAWASMFREVRQRWWLLIGLFVLMYLAIDLLSNRSPLQVFMSYATFSAHNAYWRAQIFEWGLANVIGSAEKDIVGSPLTGIGLNDWVRPHYMYSGSMDNFWLVMTVRYGLPGFFFLAVGYVVAIARIMRRDFEQDARLTLFRRAWVFTFLGLTFTLCTVHVWSNIYSFIFFMFGAGMWLITVPPGAGADQPTAPVASSATRFAARRGDAPRTADTPARPDGQTPARGMPYSRFPPRHPPRDRS